MFRGKDLPLSCKITIECSVREMEQIWGSEDERSVERRTDPRGEESRLL